MTALLDTTKLEAVRRKFGVALQRRDTIRLICHFGCTLGQARKMIEGEDPAIPALRPRPGCSRKHWSRETIIESLNF